MKQFYTMRKHSTKSVSTYVGLAYTYHLQVSEILFPLFTISILCFSILNVSICHENGECFSSLYYMALAVVDCIVLHSLYMIEFISGKDCCR